MGFAPQQVMKMSVWQFQAAIEGYIEANSEESSGLTQKEADELWDWIN